MDESNKQQFKELLTVLVDSLNARALSVNQQKAYWIAMIDLPWSLVERAFYKAIRSCIWIPKPAELRSLAFGHQENAVLAFGLLSKSLDRFGCDQSFIFSDPIIHAAVREMGGMKRLGEVSAADFETWIRKEFERLYVVIAERVDELNPTRFKPIVGSTKRFVSVKCDYVTVTEDDSKVIEPHPDETIKNIAEKMSV